VGSQGFGPYGRVHPGGAAAHHHQRLLVLLLKGYTVPPSLEGDSEAATGGNWEAEPSYLHAGVVGVRRGANGGAVSPAEDGGGGAASGGGGGGVEPRPLRHFDDELGGGSGVDSGLGFSVG
jgi:hypothetical protein